MSDKLEMLVTHNDVPIKPNWTNGCGENYARSARIDRESSSATWGDLDVRLDCESYVLSRADMT